ncbi:hypothetical protein C823_001736 [Eubacterium plexicaudatum ASF492]|uniref:MobA/VirD2-like nuclease domain-containing protein n=1 Tax=Eubacterium plexicaudatum ASF492 TaxID=1235802 RepID=N2BER9_9FIRM|nr:hypothetical protein C823_001736 [Eubacterium plexicaudatum ASF492]
MAILKHIAVKNADYVEAQRHLIFKHDEKNGKPVLDENGNLQFRDNYYLDGINCDAFTFDVECMEVNNHFGKNQNYDDIKSHHYIISYDPMDAAHSGLTAERAQELGMEYAKKYFPGHQALICTHTDGHNGSGNIRTHIVINSVLKYDMEREEFMERPCDSRAGFKHHLTRKHLAFSNSPSWICAAVKICTRLTCSPLQKTGLRIRNTDWHNGDRKNRKPDNTGICRQPTADSRILDAEAVPAAANKIPETVSAGCNG